MSLGDNGGVDEPVYARALRLRYVHPSALLCFALFEGVTIFAALLAFAELTSWWAVLVLPLSVAGMVKINDVAAGAFAAPTLALAGTGPGVIPARREPRGRQEQVSFTPGRAVGNEFADHPESAAYDVTRPLRRAGRHAAEPPDDPTGEIVGGVVSGPWGGDPVAPAAWSGDPAGPVPWSGDPADAGAEAPGGRVYGSPKVPDNDETPAVGWRPRAECHERGTEEREERDNCRAARPFRAGGGANGRPARTVHDDDGGLRHRGVFNQGRF